MKNLTYSLLFGLIFALTSFFLTSNLYITIAVFLAFTLTFYLFVIPRVIQLNIDNSKRKYCFHFIQTFIISLAVQNSGEEAFKSAINVLPNELKGKIEGLNDSPLGERLDYLGRYFAFDFFRVFRSIYTLFEEQGGDILKLSQPLFQEASLEEADGDAVYRVKKRYLAQFGVLWGMSIAVALFVRIGLNNFYTALANNIWFLLLGGVYFLLTLGAIIYFTYLLYPSKLPLGGIKHGKKQKAKSHS